jgi:hypothetical protein
MKRIIRLTESDLTRIVKRVIRESAHTAIATQMNSKVLKSNPNGCQTELLDRYDFLETEVGPMDGGCVNDGSYTSLYVQWPKGSIGKWTGWQVQYRYETSNSNKSSVNSSIDLLVDYTDNRLIQAIESTDFYKGAKVNLINGEDGKTSIAVITRKYGKDEAPSDTIKDLVDTCEGLVR